MGWTQLLLVRSHSLGPTAPKNCCCVSWLLTAHIPILSGHLWYMEVPRLKLKSELQLPAHATTILDASCIQDLCYSLLIAAPDNYPTERGQVLKMHPHGHYVGFLKHWPRMGNKELLFLNFQRSWKNTPFLPPSIPKTIFQKMFSVINQQESKLKPQHFITAYLLEWLQAN